MLELLDAIASLHKNTKRDYIKRMADDKIHCMKVSREYDSEYRDGDRKTQKL